MAQGVIAALSIVAALGCGLVAGIFFAFSAFVMAALTRLPAAQGIAAMQSINVAVINPLFFLAFFGTAAVCLGLAAVALADVGRPGAWWLLAGAALYLAGCILVTIAGNVPLNAALAGVAADSAEGAELWERYVSEWTRWNHLRSLAALAAAGCHVAALR